MSYNSARIEVLNTYLIPNEVVSLKIIEEQLPHFSDGIRDVASVFIGNIRAALSVASVPFLMAQAAAQAAHFERHHIAMRIRAGVPLQQGNEEAEEWALDAARKAASLQLSEPAGEQLMARDIVFRLQGARRDEQFRLASEELLREAIVMLWGTLEAMSSDVVRCLLNASPALAARLLHNEPTRKHFPSKGILEGLAEHKFDGSGIMGDVILRDRHLDSLPVIRDTLSVMFPKSTFLHQQWGQDGLWHLWQRRHVIVHRRGLVDASYKANVQDDAQLGERLRVSAEGVESAVSLVSNVGLALLQACGEDGLRS